MSLSQFLSGFGFRTNRPQFEPGAEHTAFVTGQDGDASLIRVGDTVLRVDGSSAPVDAWVRFRVTAFDEATSTGEAELVEVVADAD
mgnify:CR=1 FL=1